MSPKELLLDPSGIEAARSKQHVRVEPEVSELLDDTLIRFTGPGERGLDPFLAHLAGDRRSTLVEQLHDVGTGWPLLRALGDHTPQPRGEARLRAGVACGASRPNPQQDRVSIAILPDLLYGQRVAGRG